MLSGILPASATSGLGTSLCRAATVWLGRALPCSYSQGDGALCSSLSLPRHRSPRAELGMERE